MPANIDMTRLNFDNFSYFVFHPNAPALNQMDKIIVGVAIAALALFTAAIGIVVCAIVYAARKRDFVANEPVTQAIRNAIQENLPTGAFQRETGINFASNQRELRNFEREARNLTDPLERSLAMGALEIGNKLNSFGRSLGLF